MTKPTASLPLSQFRQVTVHWMDGDDTQEHVVHESEVDTFLKALFALHYEPGINPHNGGQCRIMREVISSRFAAGGPFWWTTPDLGKNHDPAGATLFQADGRQRLWIHPDYEQALRDEEREMLRAEMAA